MATKRGDEDYEIEAATKVLIVLEALEGANFEPVSVDTVIKRTGYKRDFCDRALKTLRIKGYATQNAQNKWSIGTKIIRFAASISRHRF